VEKRVKDGEKGGRKAKKREKKKMSPLYSSQARAISIAGEGLRWKERRRDSSKIFTSSAVGLRVNLLDVKKRGKRKRREEKEGKKTKKAA